MKYLQTIWQINPALPTVHQESWMGNLIATMETEFPISCSFVVMHEHRQKILTWLQVKAVGRYSVEGMPNGRIAVALGERHDAVRLRAIYRHSLDLDVIIANRSEEQVRQFFGQMKSRLAP